MLLPFIRHGRLDDLRRELQLFEVSRTQADETQRHAILRSALGKVIRGELPHHEAIVGHVLVQRLHHPVAVEVGVLRGIQPVRRLIHVAGQIQPVTRPALAVVGARECLPNGVGPVGLVRRIRRRQSSQVKSQSTLQNTVFRPQSRLQSCRLHLRENEVVDPRLRPGCVFHLRRRHALERRKRPRQRLRTFVLLCQSHPRRCQQHEQHLRSSSEGR